jgi:iron complex transport system substrate-binding protein
VPHLDPENPRILSLVPSGTEVVAALGGLLVGRSHECDYPPEVLALPAVTSARTSASAPGDIDRQVRESLAAGQSLYALDESAIRDLRAQVIVTQDLCGVCSIDAGAVRRLAGQLSPTPTIATLNPTTIEGVLDDVLTVGLAIGRPDTARGVVAALRERLCRAQDHVNPYADGPSVALLEWTDPLFCAGHWNVQLIERAGGRHPLNPSVPDAGAGSSRAVSLDALAETRPEYLVIAPCGVGLDRAWDLARDLLAGPGWAGVPAVAKGRVAVVDGNAMFNRPGPRLVDAFEWLVGWLQDRPDLVPAGFPWRPWPSGKPGGP